MRGSILLPPNYVLERSHLYLWLKICIWRTTVVRKVQYSDLFFRLHGIRHTLNCTHYTLSISYLNTQNWKVLLIFTVKRFVSVAKNMYPLKRKGKLSIDLFLYFYLPFRRYWYKRRKESFLNSCQGIYFPAVSVQYFSFLRWPTQYKR